MMSKQWAWQQWGQVARAFVPFLLQQVWRQRCTQVASSLTFTTLLSLVPLTAVVFGLFAAFPIFQQMQGDIQQFIFQNFVPTAGETVQRYVEEFASHASKLTLVGVGALVFTAVMLMYTIDSAFNAIWGIEESRPLVQGFLLYWAVLSLGPFLLGASLAVSSYIISLPFLADAAAAFGLKALLLSLVPFSLSACAFTFLYVAVPKRRVIWWHGLLGGISAALLFELAKRGFAFYVTQFPTYQLIYGAMASVPIFLLWVYVSWLILVFGAVLTRSISSFQHDRQGQGRAPFMLMLAVLKRLWLAQQRGEGLRLAQLYSEVEGEAIQHIEWLIQQKFVQRSSQAELFLVRDLSQTQLLELYQAWPGRLPQPVSDEGAVNRLFTEVHQVVSQHLERPVASVFA